MNTVKHGKCITSFVPLNYPLSLCKWHRFCHRSHHTVINISFEQPTALTVLLFDLSFINNREHNTRSVMLLMAYSDNVTTKIISFCPLNATGITLTLMHHGFIGLWQRIVLRLISLIKVFYLWNHWFKSRNYPTKQE